MSGDPYLVAMLMHLLANTFGVCHSVSVEHPVPKPPATLFRLDDFR